MKKTLILIIILFILLVLYFVYGYFRQPVVKAPTESNQFLDQISPDSDFQGPSGLPSIKGPSGPPPGQ